MRNILIGVIITATLLLGAESKSFTKTDSDDLIQPGKVVVKYKKVDNAGSVNKSAKIQVTTKHGLQAEKAVFEKARNYELKKRLNLDNVFIYDVSTVTDIQNLVSKLKAEPTVEYAEPVYISRLEETPDDPLYSSQQHLPQIHAPEAWDDQYGSSSVVIGIIDSGVDWDHEDLADVIWTNTGEIADNGIDDDNNGYIDDIRGWDFVDDVSGSGDTNSDPNEDGETPDNNPMDYDGHGTHVSGIAAGETNNAIGIASVSSGALVMPLRCGWHGNDGTGYVSSTFAAEAYVYAADNGAHVTNQSSGNSGQLIVDGAFYAFLNNVLIVESAGNSNNQTPSVLGSQSWAISVASLDPDDGKSSFSNYGEYIDVSAPGSSILSTIVEPSNFYGGSKYTRFSGTSMAAPLVASVAGLVRAKYPAIDVIELYDKVVGTGDNIDAENPSHVDLLGSGKVNAQRALSESVTSIPDLQLGAVTVNETSGNSNGILESGETADLNIEINNRWAAGSNIEVTLTALDTWPVTVNDGSQMIASIGSVLDTNNSTKNVSFSISCSADAFPATVPMQVTITGTDINKTFEFRLGVSPQILFVADFEQVNGEVDFSDFYFDDFNTQKISYDYVHRLNTDVTFELLSKYSIVVWACEWAFPSLDENDRSAIEQYLDNGGSLFLSGQDIGWDLNENTDNMDVAFFNNYLKSNYIADDAGASEIFGVDGDPVTDGITSDFFQIKRSSTQQYPDAISGTGGAVPIFKYQDGTAGAIRYRGDYDLVYFSFGGYESISNEDARREVMSRIISWFSGVQYNLQTLNDTEDVNTPLEVNLEIASESTITSAKLFYDNDGSVPYDIIDMTDMGSGNYQAMIPGQPDGTDLSYFVSIVTDDGFSVQTNTVTLYVGADNEAPVIEVLSNPLRNTINLFGIDPFKLGVSFSDNSGIDASTAMLNYWVNDGSVNSVLMNFEEDDIYSGTFSYPSRLNLGDQVHYYFSVNDLANGANLGVSDTTTFVTDTTQVIDDFEYPELDWEVTGDWGFSTTKKNGVYSLSDSPVGSYQNNTNSTATYKMSFNLTPYTAGEISYYLRSQLEVGVDSFYFEISNNNGASWNMIDAVSQNLIFFSQRSVDISTYTGAGNENVQIRFRLVTNGSTTADGVFIDDVVINVTPDPTLAVENLDQIPLAFQLSQNYPNPFNPSTTINFAVPVKSDVNVTVYNVLGEVVKVLADQNIKAGSYSISFDAANTISSGIYFYRISAVGNDGRNFVETKKMMLIK